MGSLTSSLLLFGLLSSLTCATSLRDHVASTVNAVRHASTPQLAKRQTVLSSPIYEARFANVTWDNVAWQLTTTNLDQGHYQSRMSIANGYLGINVAAVGPFFEYDSPYSTNGWPLFSRRQTFASIGGFYDEQPSTNGSNYPWLRQYGGESVISGIPHWGGLFIELANGQYLDATVDAKTILNFSTTLDMKAGVTMWQYTWTPANSDGISFAVAYTMFAHKLYANNGIVHLQIQPSSDCNVSIANVLDGASAVRTDYFSSGTDGQSIYAAVRPNGISDVTAFLYATMNGSSEVDFSSLTQVSDKPYVGANASSIAQAVNVSLKAGKTAVVTKYVGGASSDGFAQPQEVAKNTSIAALAMGYDSLLISHMNEWAVVMPDDSVDNYTYPENGTLPSDPNIIESAITAVTNPYYLLQNTVGENALINTNYASINDNSISVGGLASDSYAGQIFWDAEIWMQPGLVVTFPQAAQQIANYRVVRYKQALANAQTAYVSSKTGTNFSSNAAVFPWTDGRYGNCTSTGPCFDYEYHINGDIAQEFSNYWVVTGDSQFFETNLFPVYDSIAIFYSELLTRNRSQYALTNMTDPDEYANHVDNGGYTMPLIADTLTNANMFRDMFDMPINDTFTEQAANIFISRNVAAGIIEEYTGMNGSISVKQADVILDTFPLNYQKNYTAQDSLNDLDFYAGKQSLNGPGMTYAIFSIVASQVSPSGCSSYTYQQYSEQPYARAPWFQLSEQLLDDFDANGGTNPAYPFLTGHGGANQVAVFGYLGLRLEPDYVLHLNPSLPPQIPNLKYRTFYWHGWPISAISNHTTTTITRLSTPLPNANRIFTNTSIPVQIGNDNSTTHHIPPNSTLVLSNRQIGLITTVPGNIAQCLPVASPDDFQPGQFPIAAVDGATSTKWQPVYANRSQSITVSLHSQPFQPITGFAFDWAQNPPTNFSVQFHNISALDASAVTATTVTNTAISSPYNASAVALIVPYMSNATNVTLEPPVWSGSFATLTIWGNQGDLSGNATGATVAEWAILGRKGEKMDLSERRRVEMGDLSRSFGRRLGRGRQGRRRV